VSDFHRYLKKVQNVLRQLKGLLGPIGLSSRDSGERNLGWIPSGYSAEIRSREGDHDLSRKQLEGTGISFMPTLLGGCKAFISRQIASTHSSILLIGS